MIVSTGSMIAGELKNEFGINDRNISLNSSQTFPIK